MSSRLTLGFAILASIPVIGLAGPQAAPAPSIPELLRAGDIAKAEAQLAALPASAATTALRGELAYRKGTFAEAETHYKAALTADSKTARAHFGMGKLALAKFRYDEAAKSFKRAIELDGKEAVYHLYASETMSGLKNSAEQQKELEAY